MKYDLKKLGKGRIGVIGDFCLDVYWHADMTKSELSRETPHFPLPIVQERLSPGEGEGHGDIDCGCGLPHPALGIAKRNDHAAPLLKGESALYIVRKEHRDSRMNI